jgi:hypothetical protein
MGSLVIQTFFVYGDKCSSGEAGSPKLRNPSSEAPETEHNPGKPLSTRRRRNNVTSQGDPDVCH